MGFSTELLFLLMLGLVVLGPKRLHAVLGHVAREKAEFEKASRGIQSQLMTTNMTSALRATQGTEPRPLTQNIHYSSSCRVLPLRRWNKVAIQRFNHSSI